MVPPVKEGSSVFILPSPIPRSQICYLYAEAHYLDKKQSFSPSIVLNLLGDFFQDFFAGRNLQAVVMKDL